MHTFIEYIQEQNLQEIKLSRVWQTFTTPEQPVAIITAHRYDRPPSQNYSLNYELASAIREAGYGFVWIDGAWIENKDTPEEKHVSEVSLLVRGPAGRRAPELAGADPAALEKANKTMRDFFTAQAKKYNQDAFAFKPAVADAKDNQIQFIDKNGQVDFTLKDMRLDTIATNYSRLRSGPHAGRTFVFESSYYPQSWGGSLLAYAKQLKAKQKQ